MIKNNYSVLKRAGLHEDMFYNGNKQTKKVKVREIEIMMPVAIKRRSSFVVSNWNRLTISAFKEKKKEDRGYTTDIESFLKGY